MNWRRKELINFLERIIEQYGRDIKRYDEIGVIIWIAGQIKYHMNLLQQVETKEEYDKEVQERIKWLKENGIIF